MLLTTPTSSKPPSFLLIGLGVAAGVVCLGATGTTLFYWLKKRKSSADETRESVDIVAPSSGTHEAFELEPVVRRGHKEIGRKYYQLSTLVEEEAREIYLQTGHLIVFPEGQKKFKYLIGRGQFGAIKMAQRIENGQYVVSKKVKGEGNIRASEAEANMQQEAAGANILPIYNTIRLDEALYHFMPLAGLGDGCTIQQRLSTVQHSRLTTKILKFVAQDLLRGLQTIHNKGIFHLDIKPDNLVFTREGTGYITDFGCAKKAATPQFSSEALGDNRYFSPERLQACMEGIFDGEKADIWAAGMALLQIIHNTDPLQLFEMDNDLALRVRKCNQVYFQEKLKQFKALQEPQEGNIWWVIRGLLDVNPETRLTAQEALGAPCFKGLNNTLQERVFEDLRKETFAQHGGVEGDEVDLRDYGRIAQMAPERETARVYLSERNQQFYGYSLTPSHVSPRYQLTPDHVKAPSLAFSSTASSSSNT